MNFDIIHFTIPIVFTFFIAIVIFLFIFCHGRKSKFQPDYNNAIPIFEVVKALEKVCPMNTSNKWKLLPLEYGCHRCWSQVISFPFLKNINLYGSETAVNATALDTCTLIADVSKWPEWNPYCTSQYIIKSFHDKQLRQDQYMEAEQVISIIRETNKIQSHTFVYRFHGFSKYNVGWILFWNPKMLEFLFFLIQPIKNKNDGHWCLLTHIMGSESELAASSISLVSQRLRNIQDGLSLSSLSVVPCNFMSKSENSNSLDVSPPSNAEQKKKYFTVSSVKVPKKEVQNTAFVLVPFVPSIYEFWKRDVEYKLAVKNMNVAACEKKSHLHDLKEDLSHRKDESPPKRPLKRTISDVGMKSKLSPDESKFSHSVDVSKEISSSNKANSDTSEDSESKTSSSSKGKTLLRSKSQSFSETAVNKLDDSEFSCKSKKYGSNPAGIYELYDISENVEDKFIAMDEQSNKEMFNSSVSDFEIVENCEFTENRIAGFLTQGNYGAAELQAEALLASHFADDMNSGKFQAVGGWMFDSYHKGLCVLSKTTSNKFLRIYSFLCQTEIAVAPKDVWRFVKNPQFRFICDETVKSVEVLEKISSSQKLIHTYHEVGGWVRKELIDFCLLQTEREETNKYYSCFYSIEYDKCPFMKSVTRGSLRPSGWIVEKIEKDANKSLVTYMIQAIISSPDSIFVQELSTMVPQSVYNLKNYITSKPM